jgi:uncharacterized protein YcgI (DUF1989 family)
MFSNPIFTQRIPPKTGLAFRIEKGQILRITDMEGGQVTDLFCFAASDLAEFLSSGHTTDYNETLFLTAGNMLYSNLSNPMFTIIDDPAGPHIMLYAPCSQQMYETSYGITELHPNCLDNLAQGLAEFGIQRYQIGIPLNIFLNVTIKPDGALEINPPRSEAGDFIEMDAEMDLIVGVSACPAGECNDFSWSAVDIEIFEANPGMQD